MQYTDEQILEVVNKKDRVLFKRLYDVYYAALCHYASRLLREVASEEDVVQEIFVKFWEADVKFDRVKALTGYLYRAVYNACLNVLRDRKERAECRDLPDTWPADDFLSSGNERYLIEEEYFRQIYVAIDRLPLQRRQIIRKSLQGKRTEQIAEELGVSVNTVKTLKRKAYKELRDSLPAPLFWFILLAGKCL